MKAFKSFSTWFESWLVWLSVTGVVWAMGLVLAVITVGTIAPASPSATGLALVGLAGGALLGLGQWLVLKPQTRGIGLWTLASALGWAVSLAAVALPLTLFDPAWAGILSGVLGGAIFGSAQLLALRPEAKRVEWLLMTVSGWTAAMALSFAVPNLGWGMYWDGVVRVAVSTTVGLVLLGIVAIFARILLFPDVGRKNSNGHVGWWV